MCLHPQAVPPIPETTACIARAAFPKGNIYMKMRDELGVFWQDQDFARLYPSRGQSAVAPWRLALVTIMQYIEGLSDRQAANAVRARIDWKYALSLELTDTGFDFSILSEFRDRLLDGRAENQLFNKMLERFQELDLLRGRGKQRTDSTHVLSAIRVMTRLEFLGETLRYALNALAEAVPSWLQAHVPQDWYDCYGKRFEDARLPTKPKERDAFACQIGADGFYLLDVIYADPQCEQLRQIEAVEILRQIWLQQFYAPNETVQLRSAKDSAPAAIRIRSPYDLEARRSAKRTMNWTGYRVHLTETCDEERPHLITHVETVKATTQDQLTTPVIHQALAFKELLPDQHMVDQGYTSAQILVDSQRAYDIDLVGPVAVNQHWQAKAGQGYALSDFQVNWKTRKVRCPQGKYSNVWKKGKDVYGHPVIHVGFRHRHCSACPVRAQCTKSKSGPRSLTFQIQENYEALQNARERQQTKEFEELYAIRAGVEGTISQGVRAFEIRQCRYIGMAKTRLQHVVAAIAMNVVRAVSWLEEVPLAQTRQSRFAKLAPVS